MSLCDVVARRELKMHLAIEQRLVDLTEQKFKREGEKKLQSKQDT